MRRDCDRCGSTYDAQRPSSRFCSARCRVAAGKARKDGLPESVAVISPASPIATGLADATRRELEAAGRVDTSLGQAALALAARIDQGSDTGSALAAVAKELRATMVQALDGADVEADLIDELRARRVARLHA